MPRSRENIWRNTFILHFLPQIISPCMGRGEGQANSQVLVSLPYRFYIPNLDKIGPAVLEKMLKADKWLKTDENP